MDALKSWMSARSFSQAALARELGVSQPTVNDWLKGRTVPKVEHLLKLRELTGISVDDLLEQCVAA